jgi:uncharacterized alpha-E superfamily protein
MLSRVADTLYWMSRYLERAEHTARVIDVNLNLMLDQSPASAAPRWEHALACLRAKSPEGGTSDPYAVCRSLTFDLAHDSSISACIASARENARQVRELIGSEMWEGLNRLYFQVRRASLADIWSGQPQIFFNSVKDGVNLFRGITDSTLCQGESYHFIAAGRFLERATSTAALLDVYFGQFADWDDHALAAEQHLEWVGVLACCTAFEAYCKEYTADLRPTRIVEFLLLNDEFPHSVRFAADRVQSALEAIGEASSTRKTSRIGRLAGRLRATLSFGQIDEIVASGLHAYLDDVLSQCNQIHAAIYQHYIAYPIETALEV